MSRFQKGKARPNTIVVKILDLRSDWVAKVPKLEERDAALKSRGSDWKKFMNFCGASHIINNRCNMSMDMYFLFIDAAGLNYDTYWDSAANPDDYIESNKKSTPVKDKVEKPEKVYINVTKSKELPTTSAVDDKVSTPKPLPNYPTTTKETSAKPEIVKFEKPVRKSVNSRLSNSSKPTLTVVRTIKYTDDKKIDHSSSAYATLNSLEQKMNSFRIRLPIYMCALHISTDNVIADTDITYYRDIRDGKADIKLYEYIVLSEYLMKKYNACTNSEAKSTFKQIAAVFNDIYVQTLYFNDVDTANAGK